MHSRFEYNVIGYICVLERIISECKVVSSKNEDKDVRRIFDAPFNVWFNDVDRVEGSCKIP